MLAPVTSPEQAHEGSELVRLASADNFRDVAGDGYRTTDGATLRTGVLFRSNELRLSDDDVAHLRERGLVDIFDLRGQGEIDEHPDMEVPGATWHHLEVAGIPMEAVADLQSAEQSEAVMRSVYRAFVEREGARAAFGELLRRVAHGTGPQVFHCTAGKDRTGWSAALVLRLCGVPEETVLADYLLTNRFDGTRTKYLGLVREHLGEDMVGVYEAVMVADAGYLAEADTAVAERYGDLSAYVRDGLGLGDDDVAALRARLR